MLLLQLNCETVLKTARLNPEVKYKEKIFLLFGKFGIKKCGKFDDSN